MISERRFSHIHNIHRASHLCESSDAYWGVSSGQKFSEIHYICRVSPQCEFSEVLLLGEAHWLKGFPGGSDGKESACNAGDPGLIPGLGRSPGEGNGYPLQYSCQENSMDRRAWWATVYGVARVGDNWMIFTFSVQFSLVAQSCLTLCDLMDCSTPGLPVHHQLPESTQTHVHWVGDALQLFTF